MKRLLKIMLFCGLTFIHNICWANISIIRDSEIEEVIKAVILPLEKAAGLSVKIYLLQNDTPNAFTIGGDSIFVHSGLIVHYPDPDVLRGVIAHEMGHILGKHVIRSQQIIDNYRLLSLSTAALGLLASVSNSSSGLAVILAGGHIADRSVKAYSRSYEATADQTALKLLERSRNSAIGMVKFFEQSKLNTMSSLINPYEQTHPLGQERLATLKSYNQRSKYSTSQNTPELIYKFQRAAVKLMAYTSEVNNVPKNSNHEEELTNYLQAIKYFKKGNFDKALVHIDKLIAKHPDDPYYHETKGEILFEAGRDGDLEEYNKAWQMRKNDPLITLGRAIIGITKYKDKPAKLDEFYKNLQFVLNKEPDNILALYYGAIYYEKKGLTYKGYLNSAIIADKYGDRKNAITLATEALKGFIPNTPDWYKAKSIIERDD